VRGPFLTEKKEGVVTKRDESGKKCWEKKSYHQFGKGKGAGWGRGGSFSPPAKRGKGKEKGRATKKIRTGRRISRILQGGISILQAGRKIDEGVPMRAYPSITREGDEGKTRYEKETARKKSNFEGIEQEGGEAGQLGRSQTVADDDSLTLIHGNGKGGELRGGGGNPKKEKRKRLPPRWDKKEGNRLPFLEEKKKKSKIPGDEREAAILTEKKKKR